MKDYGTHYEYICMYVDDILIFSKSPMTIVRGLEALYILKGVGKARILPWLRRKQGKNQRKN